MNISAISFGKTYISKTPVRNFQTGKKELMNFVQYDNMEDVKKIGKIAKEWGYPDKKNGQYASYIAEHMKTTIPTANPYRKYYGIEDNHKNIQALCEVKLDDPELLEVTDEIEEKINFITANPKNSYGSKTRQYSKLGISLLKEIIKLAKKDNVENVYLTDNSDGFWDCIPFANKINSYLQTFKIYGKDYDNCIEKLDEMI